MNQFDKKSQAWSALFSEPMSDLVKRYTSSVFFDKRLWQADIAGSLAHAEMLAAQHIIAPADHAAIQEGMAKITAEIESGAFEWKLDLEDVHLNIEARLTQLVGDPGKRLHTGRSRNDQVATDVRLWLRGEIDLIGGLLTDLQKALVEIAEKNVEVILPGFTHLQVAQPVSFGHHMLAYVEMFSRDAERMMEVRRRVNRLPLGAAALAGTSYPLDRERVAVTLGMVDEQGQPQVCQNSLDAVSDRDFAIEFTAAASLAMIHISRFSEELILWMSQNFSFIHIADRFTTGSSIMPQKKNPDVPELARGKTGRVVGRVVGGRLGRVGRRQRRPGGGSAGRRGLAAVVHLVHPAGRLAAALLELPSQPLADLPPAALDLAPVAGLDVHALGEAPLQPAQRGRVGVARGGAYELLEQAQRVVQAHLGEVRRAGRHRGR